MNSLGLGVVVDPGWYGKYWLPVHPRSRRLSFAGGLTRLASLVLLLTGGTAMTAHAAAPQAQNPESVSYLGAQKDRFVYFLS